MKITKKQLKQIIQEEIYNLRLENANEGSKSDREKKVGDLLKTFDEGGNTKLMKMLLKFLKWVLVEKDVDLEKTKEIISAIKNRSKNQEMDVRQKKVDNTRDRLERVENELNNRRKGL